MQSGRRIPLFLIDLPISTLCPLQNVYSYTQPYFIISRTQAKEPTASFHHSIQRQSLGYIWWWKKYSLKQRYTFCRLHGVVSQDTAIFISTAFTNYQFWNISFSFLRFLFLITYIFLIMLLMGLKKHPTFPHFCSSNKEQMAGGTYLCTENRFRSLKNTQFLIVILLKCIKF